jgi:TM2 domain-containing membrane protein YozV
MAEAAKYIPELEGNELATVAALLKELTDEQATYFAQGYRGKRKDSSTVLLLNLLGFVFLAGVHRFYLGQTGMGVIYLVTGGFCFVGTLIDIFTHKDMVETYNMAKATETALFVKSSFKDSTN